MSQVGADQEDGDWARWTLFAVLGVAAVKLGWNAFELVPMHFDESQYWTYGEDLDWGYYSKPPLVAWLIRLSTEIFGDTAFGVRFFAPLIHAAIAWMIFATGRTLFDGRTGFWAALVYLAAPGVTVSSTIMSTDPPMMLGWAVALFALAKTLTLEGPGGRGGQALGCWALMGAAVGFGLLGKYTIIAFAGGGLGYYLFARQDGPVWRRTASAQGAGSNAFHYGPLIALLAALLVFSPNLIWNAAHDFASFSHVGDNAKLSEGAQFRLDKFAEFAGAQFGVFGPLSPLALIGFVFWGSWRHEWEYRLLLWFCLPLLVAMLIQSFLSRAHPNWAAPAYIAGSILVAAWLLDIGRRAWLIGAVALGAVLGILYLGVVSFYGSDASQYARRYDPLKKTRHNHGICERAEALRGDLRFLAAGRRVAADCLFAAKKPLSSLRMLPSPSRKNHYLLVAQLDPNNPVEREETFLFVWRGDPAGGRSIAKRFRNVEVLETGEIQTHKDRAEPYLIARVQGWGR